MVAHMSEEMHAQMMMRRRFIGQRGARCRASSMEIPRDAASQLWKRQLTMMKVRMPRAPVYQVKKRAVEAADLRRVTRWVQKRIARLARARMVMLSVSRASMAKTIIH